LKRPPVVRLRRLTPGQEQRLELLRRVSTLLDSATTVPGTSIRVGLDPILGLFPGLGDLVSPLFTMGILWQARELGIPRVVQLRMIFNVAIDTLFGLVPVIGDLFDVAWRANDRNMALLDRYAHEEHPASRGDWLFVILMLAILAGLAVTPLLLVGWILSASARLFS
jgi:hypothetical protein